MMYSCVAPPRKAAYRWSIVCASSSRRAETTFFSCLGSTFGIRAISSSPLLLVIQSRWALCRQRSEELCWTTWAVATPGDEGVGRLKSRSKWGRYRPKFGFLLARLRCSVAGHLLLFLPLLPAANGNLAANPHEKPLRDLCASRKRPFAPPPNSSLVAPISLNSWQFAPHTSEICMDPLPEIWRKPPAVSFSAQFSAPFPRGSVKTFSDEPQNILRKIPFWDGHACSAALITSPSAIAP